MAVVDLATHAFSLFVSQLELSATGRFEVAVYLGRALFDCAWLSVACGQDAEIAQQWRSGDLRAGDARQEVVARFRASHGAEAADLVDERLRHYSRPLQDLAHASPYHAGLARDADGVRFVAGRDDDRLYRDTVLGAVQHELFVLNAFSVRLEWLGAEWEAAFNAVSQRFTELHARWSDLEKSR